MRSRLILALTASLAACLPVVMGRPLHAEAPAASAGHKPDAPRDLASTMPPNPLPPPVSTEHVVTVGGRTLRFKATAGAVRLSDSRSGDPLADISYVAYQLEGTEARIRPLSIALNGGPGASSAWLDLGALGPWRLPLQPALSPSGPTALVDNADTWLDFTDLLFVDPPGTGYSRMLGKNDETEKHFYSVNGDIEALSTVVRKWLLANDRLTSPKFIVGESYGGFRAPKLARRLETTEGIGIDGLVMISPVIDFSWFQNADNPATYATQLPSLVAAAQAIRGPNPRGRLQAVEAYASGPYLVDLFHGLRDAAAIKRMSAAVATLTGLDPHFVERLGGRVDAGDMTRERTRDSGRIASAYDTTITGYDPEPFDAQSRHADPILDTIKVPLAMAMTDLTANTLKWPVNARYEVLNTTVNAHWDWGGGRPRGESLSDLKTLLALDPRLHVLVAHGVTDQVTPYFASKMLIDQLPAFGDADRIRLAVYSGGHMLYIDDASRAALREDARKLVQGDSATGRSATPER